MDTAQFKKQWQHTYNTLPAPETLPGGFRQYNGYFNPRLFALQQISLQKATENWRNMDILDAGCGTGLSGKFLMDSNNHMIGTDFSHQMTCYAHEVYGRVGVADVENLPFQDNSFDAALSVGVLQCLTSEQHFLNELARVVKPGGDIVLGWMLNPEFLLYRKGIKSRVNHDVDLLTIRLNDLPERLAQAGLHLQRLYAAIFPLTVISMKNIPFWMRPFVPAYTMRCRVE